MQICNRRIRSGLTFWNMRQFLNSVLLPSSSNTAFVWDSLNSDVDLESLLIRDRFPNAGTSQWLIIALYLPGFFPLQFFGRRSWSRNSLIQDHVKFVLTTFSLQSAGTESFKGLPECSSSCASDQSNKLHPGLLFPLLLQCTFRGLDKSWCCPSGSLRMGSGAAKKTVCRPSLASFSTCDKSCLKVLLEGWNASLWWRSVHPSGISTLSSGARSTIVPPEWPWMARKWMRRPSEPKQHWSLFLSLPRRRRFSLCEFEKTPDTSSSAITASREQQRAPTTFVKDPSMTCCAAWISIHFVRQPVWTSWKEDTMVDSVVPFVSIGFPDAGSTCHLFVTRRFSFLCVDFFHVVVRSSGDHNPWEGSGILHGSHLNFGSKLFRRKCDHDLNHWADLCKSADPLHWLRTITVSE